MPSRWLRFLLALCATLALASQLPAQVMPADGTGATGGSVEMASYTTSGSYFNRELGTPLRFSYHDEGYGIGSSVVSLGSMQVFNLDGATWFLDGQGTMSDEFGGGFNLGVGYRELVNMSHGADPDRILGASFWTDGQSTKADNFFNQLGFGLESLGESYDLRMNGYFPLDTTKDGDPQLIDIDTVSFRENRLFAGLERIVTDTAHSVIDAEAAKRLGNLDAWAYTGVYHLGGGGGDETGYKIGMRGYAVPDLLLGVEYTEDDIYDNNLMATLTWFVGRTHKGNAPIGAIVDRFREPVMRNNYISTTQSFRTQGAGGPLTDADTDELFNFIHVDSNAAAGGDGSFENPYNNLAEAQAAQAENAYVYVHGGSTLAAAGPFTLLDGVKFWGEGTNEFDDVVQHVVDSVERGSLTLPETSPGAEALQSPTINVTAGQNFLILADNNDVNNFEINGGVNAVTGNAINAPQLANLDINNPTGIGISFTGITGTAVVDNTVTITGANQGMLIDGGNAGMNINARITNAVGSSLVVQNRTGGTIAYGGSIQDDNVVAATAAGIIIQNNNDAAINFSQVINNSDTPPLGININSGNFNSLFIDGNDEGTTVTFADLFATAANADTVLFNDGGTLTISDSNNESLIQNTGTGNAFTHVGSAVADEDSTITVAANITNLGGGEAVNIMDHTENNITFSGDITDTDSNGIELTNNEAGTIAFNGAVTITNSGAGNGVNASGGGQNVVYTFTDIDINITTGTGFSVTGDGALNVTSANGDNSVRTTTGRAINLDGLTNGLTIGTGGAIFDEVNVTNGGTDAVVLRDLDGGQVRIGPTSGTTTAGTIATNGTATGIVIDDAANISVNNVNIDKNGTGQSMLVVNQATGATVLARGVDIDATGTARGLVVGTAAGPNQDGNTATFTELNVTSVDGDAVAVEENDGGTYIFNDLVAATSGAGDAVHIANNSDDTIVTFNDMDLDVTGATSTGDAFSAENGGTIAATGDTSVTATTGRGVFIDDVTIGGAGAQFDTVNVTNATVSATNPTGNAVVVRNANGTGLVTIGSGTNPGDGGTVRSAGGAILIDNANNVAVTRVTVDNDDTAGNGLVIQNQDGGTVSSTGLTIRTDSGTAILAQNNTGGTNIYSNTDIDIDGASTGSGVVLNANTGATNTFNGITINTTTGRGFHALGGGTVAASGTNTVTTTTGTAVELNGVEIGAAGFGLNSVNVNGAVNGVVLTNITGSGTYRQGPATATGTAGAGGTLTTTGDSIVLNGVTSAVFNDVTANSSGGRAAVFTHTVTTPATVIFDNLTSTGGAGSGVGVQVIDNGTGELDFTLRNSTINMTAGNQSAFLFDAGASAGEVDVRLQNNISLATGNAAAVNAVIDEGTGNVQFLVTGNTVTNNSATSAATEFVVSATRTLNATVGGTSPGNSFGNGNAGGIAFTADATGNGSRINLDLRGNTGNAGAVDFELGVAAAADFGVVDRDDTFNDLNNTGNVAPAAGNVVTDFDDLVPPITQVD